MIDTDHDQRRFGMAWMRDMDLLRDLFLVSGRIRFSPAVVSLLVPFDEEKCLLEIVRGVIDFKSHAVLIHKSC
jgi:hypothetical protein